jgi:hypothetical protein
MDLEVQIMREIGLDRPAGYYIGSYCASIRKRVAEALPEAIKKHHEAGEVIIAPDDLLLGVVDEAMDWDGRERLDQFWMAISEVIAAHIHAYHVPVAELAQWISSRARRIIESYAPAHFYQRDDALMFSYDDLRERLVGSEIRGKWKMSRPYWWRSNESRYYDEEEGEGDGE